MKRRQFIAAHGGAWSQPWAINAQQTDRVRPVGRYLEAMVKLSGKAMSRPSSSLPPSIGGGTHPPARRRATSQLRWPARSLGSTQR
jgi:hypothetical protein